MNSVYMILTTMFCFSFVCFKGEGGGKHWHMGSLCCQNVYSFRLLKQVTDFNKSSCEHYAIEGHSKFCTFYFFFCNNNMVNK
jgi:hypothetical protein